MPAFDYNFVHPGYIRNKKKEIIKHPKCMWHLEVIKSRELTTSEVLVE